MSHGISDNADGRPVRVLVVDTDGLVRRGLRALLAREGFDVADATCGEAALRHLRHFAADVVIVDAETPGMSGCEATRRLAQHARSAAVLMLLKRADAAVVLDTVRAGSAGLLLKDAPSADIIAAVRAVADGSAVLDPRVASMVRESVRNSATPRPGEKLSERALLALPAPG